MRHKKEVSTCRYLFSYIGKVGENYVFSESFSGFSSVWFSLSWVLSFPVEGSFSWVSFSAFSPSCFADSSSCKISSERDTHGRFPKICSTSSEKITSREINTSASWACLSAFSFRIFLALSYCSLTILLTSSSMSLAVSSLYGLVNPYSCPVES